MALKTYPAMKLTLSAVSGKLLQFGVDDSVYFYLQSADQIKTMSIKLGTKMRIKLSLSKTSNLVLKSLLALFALVFLASCNSGSLGEGLESATPQPAQSVDNAPTPSTPDTSNQITSGQSNINATNSQQVTAVSGKSVAFLPVSNAPQSAVTNLTSSIKNAATANNVPIVASVQDGASYQVKGYFSALEDGSGTLLVYVWDVLDRSNKRVYRISGQEQSAGKSTDPWSSVTPQMIDRVASSTLAQLRTWLSSRG